MPTLDSAKTLISSIHSTADSIGKLVWVFIVAFIGVAIASGHPSLLGTIRSRLVQAGFTSINTPMGTIDPNKIGLASEVLGINAARAAEMATKAGDAKTREQLSAIASDLTIQQQQNLEELAKFRATQPTNSTGASAKDKRDFLKWIFIGRYSDGKWLPFSFSLAEPKYPLNANGSITVKSDALLYEGIDCTKSDLAGQASNRNTTVASFAKAGPAPLNLTGQTTECESVGGAKTVWAEVVIPYSRYYETN